MVMMTRSAYRRAGESTSSFDDSSNKFCNAPPWCSSGKINCKTTGKPRRISLAAFETRCPFSTDYFEGRIEYNARKRKKDNRRKQYGITPVVALCFILLFGIVLLVIASRCSRQNSSPSKSMFSLLNPIESTSIDEECCFKMKQLTAALLKAEQELRRSRRQQLLISSQKVKSELVPLNSYLTEGATITVGSNTREWSAQVTLWGLVPLWKTSLPPDVIFSPRTPTPADCWPFSGSRGEISIHFREALKISSISLEHIRPDAARSAPKYFTLYDSRRYLKSCQDHVLENADFHETTGHTNLAKQPEGISENGTWIKALQDEYSYSRPAKQLFPINIDLPPVKRIDFRVRSNQGNNKYTCVYRLNVYGARK